MKQKVFLTGFATCLLFLLIGSLAGYIYGCYGLSRSVGFVFSHVDTDMNKKLFIDEPNEERYFNLYEKEITCVCDKSTSFDYERFVYSVAFASLSDSEDCYKEMYEALTNERNDYNYKPDESIKTLALRIRLLGNNKDDNNE